MSPGPRLCGNESKVRIAGHQHEVRRDVRGGHGQRGNRAGCRAIYSVSPSAGADRVGWRVWPMRSLDTPMHPRNCRRRPCDGILSPPPLGEALVRVLNRGAAEAATVSTRERGHETWRACSETPWPGAAVEQHAVRSRAGRVIEGECDTASCMDAYPAKCDVGVLSRSARDAIVGRLTASEVNDLAPFGTSPSVTASPRRATRWG